MEKEKITGEELIELIKLNQIEITISNKIIEFQKILIPPTKSIRFYNCNFYGDLILFSDIAEPLEEKHFFSKIMIENCLFDSSIYFHCDKLFTISVYESKFINKNEIEITGNKIHSIFFNSVKTESKIKISNIPDCGCIVFKQVKQKENINLSNIKSNDIISFNNCSSKELQCFALEHKGPFIINDLNKCDLIISQTNFFDSFSFNKNNIVKIELNNVTFYSTTSIQNSVVNIISIENSNFNTNVFFDDIELTNYKSCDRKTIRTIKQQLQKTENRIDFDKYRSYELELYKKELQATKKWWNGDLFILRLNSLFSNHGTSWSKALIMTIIFGLGFYSTLYFVKNWQNEFDISFNAFNHFTSGYFKFMLVTNFYDPLSEKREFLSCFVEWIPFIFGKIFIGYGLYETIQAFRKYRK